MCDLFWATTFVVRNLLNPARQHITIFFYMISCSSHIFTYVVSFFSQATINIVFDRVGKTDPVTRGIEITVNYLGIQFDVRSRRDFIM